VRIFKITGGDVTIAGLRIANGFIGETDGHGGGIYNSSPGTVTVTRSTLSNNGARGASGISSCTSPPPCCYGGGGAIYHSGPGALNIVYSTVSGNSATGGNGNSLGYGTGGGGGGGGFGAGLFNDGAG